ncbi:iron-containing redox enzyme family protein [Methylomonas sp. EFPC1]|uniref:iron-containing redox enzyme family protein n=1 Tax=Methylomonas sp. EFPC1 TaxID=2812647 RepID=UPI001F086A23|nr:iron-containing redox enzyme family protein [Methylomonas sp. EFPC1]
MSDTILYASGTNYPDRPPALIKSIDGGATWTHIEMKDYASLLVDVYFRDELHGWVVGGAGGKTRPKVKPVVLYTQDGGNTWVNQLASQSSEFPFGEWGWKIQFLQDGTGFISLENFDEGAILKSIDDGQTWIRLSVNDAQRNANLEGIGFIDANHGWVGGWGDHQFQGGYTSETSNGGDNWRNANHVGKFINRFRFIGSPLRVGYASGDTVYKYAESARTVLRQPFSPKDTPRLILNKHAEVVTKELCILLDVPEGTQHLTVNLWDRFGSHLVTLVDEAGPVVGPRHVSWDFQLQPGQSEAIGHFIYRVNADDLIESRVLFRWPSRCQSRVSVGTSAHDVLSSLEFRLMAQPAGNQTKLPLPTFEEEKEAFYRVANIEDYPEFRPTALKLAKAYLANADYDADELYRPFEYTPETFDDRMRAIYEALLPGMDQPYTYDRDVITWSNGKRYRIGRASDAVVRDQLLQLAPFNLMDGIWLQGILQAGPSDEVRSRLFSIWADEVGDGQTSHNHSNVYQDLLRSQGIYLPPVTSRAFLDLDLAPGAWRTPVFQAVIGLFPQMFFPELIGMTLFLEWEATPTLQPKVRMLRNRGINPLFYSLHVAIDNISAGHGAIAKEAVKLFLADKLEEGGDQAVQENWRRIWNGYVTWATAGFNGEGLAERRLIIDKKSINIGSPEAPDCFPKWSTYYRDRMIRLIQRKAPIAAQVHGRRMLGGVLLNDLFAKPEELLDKLIATKTVNIENPRSSKLFDLMSFEGPMHRVFTDEEKNIILDWLESLSAKPQQCLEPIPENPVDQPWPEKMAQLIANYARVAKRAHDKLILPDDQGRPIALVDVLDDSAEMMRSLVRGGWVVPGEPERSIFLTRIMENGGPMEGVFATEDVETVRQWIIAGALPPGLTGTLLALDSKGLKDDGVLSLLDKRPFIGQGSVH